MTRKSIVLFDHDEGVRFVLRQCLSVFDEKIIIFSSNDTQKAQQLLGADIIDLLITEIGDDASVGAKLSKYARNLHPNLKIIWLTALGCNHNKEQKKKLGNIICIEKPIEINVFRSAVSQALKLMA